MTEPDIISGACLAGDHSKCQSAKDCACACHDNDPDDDPDDDEHDDDWLPALYP
jgi:hypothetical protein